MKKTLECFNMNYFREAADYGWNFLGEDGFFLEMEKEVHGSRGLNLNLTFMFDANSGDVFCDIACSCKNEDPEPVCGLDVNEIIGASAFQLHQNISYKALEKGMSGISMDSDMLEKASKSIEQMKSLTLIYANAWKIAC